MPARALIRLCADGEGRLRLAPKGPGRGAWVQPTEDLLCRLEKGPGQAGRSLRRGGLTASGLLEDARAAADLEWHVALERCRRAGSLRSGRAQLGAAPTPAPIAALCAAGASPRALPPWAADLLRFPVDLDATALGRLIGRGPRAVIIVTSSSPSARLIASLQRRAGLGYTPRPSKDGTVGDTSHSAAIHTRGVPGARADHPSGASRAARARQRQPTAAAASSSEGSSSTP